MAFKTIKYAFIIFIISKIIIQISYAYTLPLLNETLYKKGFTKKQPFNIAIGYEYSNNSGFNILNLNNNIQSYNINIDSSKINKSSNGIKTEASIYLTPFIKIFIDYTFRNSKLDINYKINQKNNYILTKDFVSTYSNKSNEHIYMAGFEATYEWTIKKYTPYILLKAGFGTTVSSSYDDIFYNSSISIKAGTHILFNNNFKLNVYTGIDYTTLFNNGNMIENIDIVIPEDYLLLGLPPQTINTNIEYIEHFNKNLNMVLGFELDLYKHTSIFTEIKYINNLLIYSGIKVMF